MVFSRYCVVSGQELKTESWMRREIVGRRGSANETWTFTAAGSPEKGTEKLQTPPSIAERDLPRITSPNLPSKWLRPQRLHCLAYFKGD